MIFRRKCKTVVFSDLPVIRKSNIFTKNIRALMFLVNMIVSNVFIWFFSETSDTLKLLLIKIFAYITISNDIMNIIRNFHIFWSGICDIVISLITKADVLCCDIVHRRIENSSGRCIPSSPLRVEKDGSLGP